MFWVLVLQNLVSIQPFTSNDNLRLSYSFVLSIRFCFYRYSIDGGKSWTSYAFAKNVIMVRDLVTQPGERLPIFLIYGHPITSAPLGFKPWIVFSFNLTSVLGEKMLLDRMDDKLL